MGSTSQAGSAAHRLFVRASAVGPAREATGSRRWRVSRRRSVIALSSRPFVRDNQLLGLSQGSIVSVQRRAPRCRFDWSDPMSCEPYSQDLLRPSQGSTVNHHASRKRPSHAHDRRFVRGSLPLAFTISFRRPSRTKIKSRQPGWGSGRRRQDCRAGWWPGKPPSDRMD
jgi:hypothetical protein